MSNTPIFDQLSNERNYDRMLASFPKRQMPSFFAKREETIVEAKVLEPDPYLDGPFECINVQEPEEEVLAVPFVKIDGIPRGTGSPFQRFEREGCASSTNFEQKNLDLFSRAKADEEFDPLDFTNFDFYAFLRTSVENFVKEHPNARNIEISSRQELDGTMTLGIEGMVPTHDLVEGMGDVLADVRDAFRQEHPGAVMTAVTAMEEHEDGSATLTVEGQSLIPVKPLSERNTA
jgi:hypothetical protein